MHFTLFVTISGKNILCTPLFDIYVIYSYRPGLSNSQHGFQFHVRSQPQFIQVSRGV